MTRRIAVAALLIALSAALPGGRGQAQNPAALPAQALAQMQALAAEKRSRTPAQRKIDSQLLFASRMARGQAVSAGLATLDTHVRPELDGRVVVDVRASVTPALLARLRTLGADVLASHPAYDDVRLQVPFDQLEAIAALPEVRHIAPKAQAITQSRRGDVARPRQPRRTMLAESVRTALAARAAQDQTGPIRMVGSRGSQGDRTHLAGAARGKYGVTGAGVKIGVLSDSVDGLAQAQASGDLPAVTVLPDKSGTGMGLSGEGTAMLEIIHDLAPGAQLFFATAFISAADFAQNIRDLRNVYGCDIIVDDVFYFNESPFQDGQTTTSPTNGAVITQAVKEVAASGALYFSSAGNSGNLNDGTSGTWEGDFISGGAVGFPEAGEIHQFAPGQNFNVINGTGLAINLKWADPLDFGPKNDYDLFRLSADGTMILGASTNDQQNGADPYEQIAPGSSTHRIVIVKWSGSPVFLHLSTVRGLLSIATDGEINGHSATSAANSFGVSATPAQSPGPYPNPFVSANAVETFTSDGPRRIFFTESGTAITAGNFSSTGGIVLNKPDLTAADGVSVTGSNGLFPTTFFGTSAAAPHAAAIAALIKSRPGPALTPTQIRAALMSTAIDIEAPGFDRDSGVGIVMADAAIAAVEHNFTPPAGNVVLNGDFSTIVANAPANWTRFATPDQSYIVSNVTNGVFRFYRVDPGPGVTNQAVVFQNTGITYGPNWPVRAQFDLGNSDSQRKRISVLMLDGDFSDLAVCTFWLPPNSPLTTYRMRTHTNKVWANASIYFYAASAGSNGGFYLLDNVSLQENPGGPTTETECVDPLAPAPTMDPPGAELLVNGDFDTGALSPWTTFGTITSQINAGPHPSIGGTQVFEFTRPNATPPAGVVFQATAQPVTAGQILTATFQLGNSSPVLKRVTAIVHDLDFSDLSACTFYLLPGQMLKTYVMRTYTTKAWTNATLSLYGATIGPDAWIRFDNASLRRTQAAATVGTDCEEPAVTTFVQSEATAGVRPMTRTDADATRPSGQLRELVIDLTHVESARLKFASSLQFLAPPVSGSEDDASAEVQVSIDGNTWITLARVGASAALHEIEVDLSPFAGRLIWIRFVLVDVPAAEPQAIWRISRVQIR